MRSSTIVRAGFLALSVAGLATPSLAQTGAPASDSPSEIVLPYLAPGAAAPPYLAPGAAVLPYRAPGAAVPYLAPGAIVLPPVKQLVPVYASSSPATWIRRSRSHARGSSTTSEAADCGCTNGNGRERGTGLPACA